MKIRRNRYASAFGISYESSLNQAPEVCVKGEGVVADQIVRYAKRYGVPVVERAELAELLQGVSLDESIPEDLYEAVALILCELKSF